MNKILLSFLGTGNYQETVYRVGNQQHTSKFFAEALCKFYPDYNLAIVLTEEARVRHYDALKQTCTFQEVSVPSGKNEHELWEMFSRIEENIPAQSKLVVDVTHGFRSQPMLALAACIYLRAAKDVNIEGIIYGAFEAKDSEGVAPVFDLTPFLELIDWSVSAQQFVRYGNAAPMRDLLRNIHSQTHKNQGEYKAKGLTAVGERLAELSRALGMVRPKEVLAAAGEIPQAIEKAQEDLSNLNQAQPFNLLLDKINQRIEPLTQAQNALFTPEGFTAQAAMIRFYLDTEQYTQAITLAREALVSKVCVQQNLDTVRERKKAEEYLNNLEHTMRRSQANLSNKKQSLARLWSSTRDLRNDINHAGMNPSPTPAKTALENVQKECEKVIKLVIQ